MQEKAHRGNFLFNLINAPLSQRGIASKTYTRGCSLNCCLKDYPFTQDV